MKSVFIIFQLLLFLIALSSFLGIHLLGEKFSTLSDPIKTESMVSSWDAELSTWVGYEFTEEMKNNQVNRWRAILSGDQEVTSGIQELFLSGKSVFAAIIVFQILSFAFLCIRVKRRSEADPVD